jgi:hypothetical protein
MGKKRVLVGYGGKCTDSIISKRSARVTHNSRRGCCVRLVNHLMHFPNIQDYSQWIRINTQDGSAQNGTNVSRGIFGATVGIDRLLKLFDKHDIRATFLLVSFTSAQNSRAQLIHVSSKHTCSHNRIVPKANDQSQGCWT